MKKIGLVGFRDKTLQSKVVQALLQARYDVTIIDYYAFDLGSIIIFDLIILEHDRIPIPDDHLHIVNALKNYLPWIAFPYESDRFEAARHARAMNGHYQEGYGGKVLYSHDPEELLKVLNPPVGDEAET